MVEQVSDRYNQAPASWLVDGSYVGHEQIDRASETTVVYGPLPESPESRFEGEKSMGFHRVSDQ